MPYCPSCGTEVLDENVYCPECGKQLPGVGQSTEPSTSDAGPDHDSAAASGSVVDPAPEAAGQSPEEQAGEEAELVTAKRFVYVGAALVAVGAFLPWFSVQALGTSASFTGIERDGILTFGLAIVVAYLAWRVGDAEWSKRSLLATYLVGVCIAGLSALYIYDPWYFSSPPNAQAQQLVQVGIGLYVTLVGGGSILAGPMYCQRNHDFSGSPQGDATMRDLLWVLAKLVGGVMVALVLGVFLIGFFEGAAA